ncbi:molybdenum cofactor guanylyltransferase [Bacillus xiapuensis]|uniref:molybdenum cofactor guanylyltransferase n=1 Tax=Bacillus xiapuensis TaxID=2014075 RepID=UPI000C238148|nr:molybdenum cofactor guanylyltransferase [Bacillus xiapuensis]
MKIAGVVLAGGQSSRYGKPKMFEMYQGKYFYQHSLLAFKAQSLDPLIISTNTQLAPRFQESEAEIITEKEGEAFQGPLFALHNVMSKVEADWFFILASDMPFVTADFVKHMLRYTENKNCDVIVPVQSSKFQTLAALYHRRNFPVITQLLQNKKRSMMALLKQAAVKTVAFPDQQKDFININHSEDWLIYQAKP